MNVRDERAGEEAVVAALTKAAFRDATHSDGTEHALAAKLRQEGDLTVSLIAEVAGEPVGHVASSPVEISDDSPGWFGLAPVAVVSSARARGVGSALIRDGIGRLLKLGACGCVVLGEPAYYRRFGFEHDPRLVFPGPPPEYFQRLVLKGRAPVGTVRYAPAFY